MAPEGPVNPGPARGVIFSEGLAKIAAQYLVKGSKVYLEGQIQTRKWTDQAGAHLYREGWSG